MEYFKDVFIIFYLNLISAKWIPELNFQPNFDQFQYYESNSFHNIYSASDALFPVNFEWQSIGSATLKSINYSYVVFGGSNHINEDSTSAFYRKSSTVILCELKLNSTSTILDKVICTPLKADDNSRYLGATVKAISLSNSEIVIVYCDPLWHVADSKEPKPNGKCYLLLKNDKQEQNLTSIEFCKLSATSYSTCMGGFSVDLISMNNQVNGIEMLVGMPHMIPFGGVKIVNNPFGQPVVSQPRNGIGKYYNFGYSVAMTSNSDGYVSSPLSDQYGPNVTNIREDLQLTSPDNIPFSSFGVTLTTLSIFKGKRHAVVIGAPFHSVKSIQNVGKVYIFCSSNKNRSAPSDFLHGKEKDEFFGYFLANIGDINGDGNQDLAISSPFLRDDEIKGFVALYTINENCEIKQRPYQILKSQQPKNAGIFGIAITGGSDMDFNGWPDIIVSSTRSNSIEMFASRQLYTAKCIYSTDSNFEVRPLNMHDNITVTLSLSLVDFLKNQFIDINFLKQSKVLSQVKINENSQLNRFKLITELISMEFETTTGISITFTIMSLQNVKDMNLTTPVTIGYRFVENCEKRKCNNLFFPLIDWEKCTTVIPITKYICSNRFVCNADISVELIDKFGNEVIYGLDKSYHRTLELKIYNNGPTEGKGINFKITTFQNLRISKISAADTNIKDIISTNQTKAICKLENYEIDANEFVTIDIDLYFVDFKDSSKMIYENNYVLIELFSDVTDSNLTNNVAKIDYIFIYEPNISLSASSKQDTVIDSRNRSQPMNVGQRVTIDIVGPRLSQTFIIDNIGKAVINNMVVKISVPIQTKDNLYILYLFDKIRGVNQSQVGWMSIVPHATVGAKKYPCSLPSGFVNPLKIIGFETHESHLKDIDKTPVDGLRHFIRKRSADQPVINRSTKADKPLKMSQGKMHRIPVEIIQCNRPGVNLHSPICGDITCEIPFLPANKQARIQINAWLYAHTFFKKQISDIMVYSTLSVDFKNIPNGVKLKFPSPIRPYSQFQQFIFKNVKPKIVHIKPLWPIIVGIVIGTLILAILIVALYKCGFFKRNKRRRHFRSKKVKKYDPVIVHPADIQNTSSITTETRFTSHSALIDSKN